MAASAKQSFANNQSLIKSNWMIAHSNLALSEYVEIRDQMRSFENEV